MIIEENFVYLICSCVANLKVIFFFKYQDRMGQAIAIMIGYVVFLVAIAGFYLALFFYQKFSKHFIPDGNMKM